VDETKLTPDDYGFPAEELVGRLVQTPFGQETCVLKHIFWAYYDWLEAKGFNPQSFFAYCYKRHPELDISRAMTWLLHHLACYRQHHDLENPSWLIPSPLPPGQEEF
jgi:hypothetical protein